MAKISRNRLIQEFITFQLQLNSPNYSLMLDRSHSTRQQDKKQQNTATTSLNFNTCCSNPHPDNQVSDNGGSRFDCNGILKMFRVSSRNISRYSISKTEASYSFLYSYLFLIQSRLTSCMPCGLWSLSSCVVQVLL